MKKLEPLDEILKNFHEDAKLKEQMEYLIKNATPQIIGNIEATEEEKNEMEQKLKQKIIATTEDSIKIGIIYEDGKNIDSDVERVVRNWNRKTDDEKKSELIYDEAFEKIVSYSIKAWKIAKNRAKTGEICQNDEQYNEMKKALEKDHSDVKEFNKKYIEQYVSEGLLDLDYGFGKAETVSLRVGRYM